MNLNNEDQFLKIIKEHFDYDIPKVCYHYTSFFALNSILNSFKLKFTYIKDLNDPNEFSYFLEIIIEEIKHTFSDSKEVLKFLYDEIQEPHIKPYVFSSSLVDDKLSQWRGYADLGSGISIGIKPNFSKINDVDMYPGKVIYNENIIKQVANKMVQELNIQHIKKQRSLKDLMLDFYQSVYIFSCFSKKQEWSEENEFRVVALIFDNLKNGLKQEFYSNKTKDIFLYPIDQSQVLSITVGPKNFGNKNIVANLNKYIGDMNYKYICVSTSKIELV